MTRRLNVRKAIFITGLMAALPAWSCNQGDLTGRWNLFYEDFSCLMTVQPDGRATAGQCLHLAEDPDEAGSRNPVRGRLTMRADCRVTGRLNTRDRDDRSVRLTFGQTRMSQDALALHGVVHVGRSSGQGIDIGSPDTLDGEYANFTAVLVD